MTQAFGRTGDRPTAPILGVLAIAWICLGATTLQERGTQADQDACTPDVFRLCSAFIPDEPQILTCLQSKRTELSPACGKVVAPTPDRQRRRRIRQDPS